MGICTVKGIEQDNDFEPKVNQLLFNKLELEAVDKLKVILKKYIQTENQRKISMNDLFLLPADVKSQLSEAEQRLIKIEQEKLEERQILNFNIIDDTKALIQQLEQEEKSPQKYILVIGITGQGKSTFINSFANYLNNHYQLEDNLRTRLIMPPQNSSAGSVTREISAYRQTYEGQEIILIDTPGLKDTGGNDEDTRIVNYISEFINRLRRLDLICIVSESQQNYIIENNTLSDNQLCIARVLKLFGKSIANKMVHILTFSDFGNLKESNFTDNQSLFKIQMENIQPKNRKQYFYQFQNSVTYCNDTGLIERLQFARNLINYQRLFQKLTTDFFSNKQGNEDNLADTHEVIKIRAAETSTINEITQQLGVYNEIQKNIIRNKKLLSIACSNMEQSQNFTYIQKVPVVEERLCEDNYYVTNCNICRITCHQKCEYNDDINKQNCYMMKSKQRNSKPQCVMCDHYWDEHRNSRVIYLMVERNQTFTYEDMKRKYDKALSVSEVFQQALQEEHNRGTQNKEIVKFKLNQLREQIKKLYNSALFKINLDINTNDQILSKFPRFQNLIQEIEADLKEDSNLQSE